MNYRGFLLTLALLFVSLTGCDMVGDLDVENENSPNLEQVFADPQEYPSLLKGSYRTWWNESIGANPNLALGVAGETITSGYGSWGMSDYYRMPRQAIVNQDADDPVLNPLYGAWYSYSQGLPAVNNVIRQIDENGREVTIGETDYTQGALTHAYFLQGLLLGHIALIYDQGFLIDETVDVAGFDYTFTAYEDLIDFALGRMDQAIGLCSSTSFTDPIEMLPNVQFDSQSLCRFINSSAARLLVASARTQAETAALDWERVKQYARNGLTEDFAVFAENGWTGLAISRDPYNLTQLESWDWIRPNHRLVAMMAGDDDAVAYPRPDGVAEYEQVTDPMDQRLLTDFEYVGQHARWNPASRGYHILSEYSYTRYNDYALDGVGDIFFFLAAENDLLLAEAIVRTTGPTQEAAELVNRTRVERGGMPALTGNETPEAMLEAIFHERYVELLYTYHPLGYFDRRRTDDLVQGTPKQFPVPAKELLLHGFTVYTFGG